MLNQFSFAVLVLILNIPGPVFTQQAPKVARAVPDHFDIGVDANLNEILVEFDQEMNQTGQSIVGGGPSFPMKGKSVWINNKTISIPVQLEPGRRYALSINSARFRNFQSAAGVPAEPYPIEFQTVEQGKELPEPFAEKDNEAAFSKLVENLMTRYSYRDLHKVDWQKRAGEFKDRFLKVKTASAFARLTAEFLAVSKDPHVTIRVGDFAIAARTGDYPAANYSDAALTRSLKDLKKHNPVVITAKTMDDIPYLMITGWVGNPEAFQPALEFIDSISDQPKLILDVRVNGGGNETLASEVAGCFLKKDVVYSKHRIVDPDSRSGFGEVLDRTVKPNKNHKHFGGKVAVLMGPRCMSSNESFLLMLRQSPQCQLIGEPSFGSSGNPQPHELGNGVTVLLPSWQNLLVDGSLLEGKGVAPDIEIKTSPKDFAGRDPVIEKAIEFLSK